MSLNICAHCTTKFAIGVPHCPQCGNADYYEEGTMAKITRHGGATTVQDITAPVEVEPEAVDEEEAAPFSEYATWLIVDLREALRDRGLPVSGNKDELVDRLEQDDAARSQPDEVEDDEAADEE